VLQLHTLAGRLARRELVASGWCGWWLNYTVTLVWLKSRLLTQLEKVTVDGTERQFTELNRKNQEPT